MSNSNYDFCGWATKNNLKCSDGRTIMKDAFKHMDGKVVPLVWNHKHEGVIDVLGHALLENRAEGVYAYGTFNDTESGQTAKLLVEHGDVDALSIYANNLKQNMANVIHGDIREVSLVLAGANPGAFIESVIKHGEESEEEARIFTGEYISLTDEFSEDISHAEDDSNDDPEDDETVEDVFNTLNEKQKTVVYALIGQALEGGDSEDISHAEGDSNNDSEDGETVEDVFNTLNEKQKTVVYALIGQALEDSDNEESDEENEELKGGNETMKHNVFDGMETENQNVLTHADQEDIISLAKQSNVGSLKHAMEIYAEENALAHGIFEDYEVLFPEYELLRKGEPETLEKYNKSWVGPALAKIHKSPFSRIRTRQADARIADLKAKGYQNKGDQKTVMNKIKMIGRTTDPQTIYIKDDMHRDDIIDVTDFSVVDYQWRMMRSTLDETIVLAALIGDGREEGDPDKIHEAHVRSIWNDEELYTMHHDVDVEAARAELQGTNTNANFGENYIYAEAIITAALYSREKFKGTGTPDFYCTPHLVNVMLLARDLNGRRIYDSKSDLAKALNVNSIVEVEQFEGKTRTTEGGKTKKLLGLFVNLADYQFGSTKGGEITRFEDFDMDFNKQKFMLETRLSGSLTRVESAIALEEPVASEEEVVNG